MARRPVPADVRATTVGYSVRPRTRMSLQALCTGYDGATISAMIESLVEDAFIHQVEWAALLKPEVGYAPMHGMTMDEILNDHVAFQIWHPKHKTIGFRYRCACEIRGDGSSYAWVPCGRHVALAEEVSAPGFVRLKPIAEGYRGGFLRPMQYG